MKQPKKYRNRYKKQMLQNQKKQREQHNNRKQGIYENYIKRPLDFICALFAIILLSPVMLVISALVRIRLGSPVLFTQERPGLHGKIFKLYKFRSMSDTRDKNGNLLPDEQRLGSFGKTLRATSLDELPELFNILKGDMSIVGPRPLLVKYLPYYTEQEQHRHDARPGLTGISQISGRNNLPWKERLQLDVKYVTKITFWSDISILFKTIKKVISKQDIAVGSELKIKDLDIERGSNGN